MIFGHTTLTLVLISMFTDMKKIGKLGNMNLKIKMLECFQSSKSCHVKFTLRGYTLYNMQ